MRLVHPVLLRPSVDFCMQENLNCPLLRGMVLRFVLGWYWQNLLNFQISETTTIHVHLMEFSKAKLPPLYIQDCFCGIVDSCLIVNCNLMPCELWCLWVIPSSTPSPFSFFPLPVFHLLAVSACCSECYLVLHRLVAKTSLTSPPWPEVKLPDPVEEAKYHAGKSLKSGLPTLPWGLIEHKCLHVFSWKFQLFTSFFFFFNLISHVF